MIENIDNDTNIRLLYYVLYEILSQDTLTPTLNNTPTNGLLLFNKETNKSYDIYHVHLEEGCILLWYLIWNEKSMSIHFDYIKHPTVNDDYKMYYFLML